MSKTHYPVGTGGCFGGCGDNAPYKSKIEAANVCFDPAGSCNEGSEKPIVSTNLQAAMHELICQFNCLEDVYVASGQLANGILTFYYNNTNIPPFQVDLNSLNDIYVNGGNYNPATMVLTLSDNDGTTPDITLDLSTLISSVTDNGNGTYTHSAGGQTTVIDTNVSTDSTISGDGVNTPLSVDCAAIIANCGLATMGDIKPASGVVNNGDGTYTHTNGDGVVTVINTNTPHVSSSVVDNGDGTYTHTNGEGQTVVIDTNTTQVKSSLTNNGDGTFTHNDGDGNVTQFDANSQFVDNNDGTYTHTNAAGDNVVIDTNTTHVPSTIVDNGNGTYTFNNGAGQVLLIDVTQSHSALVNNNDGTFTHTSGDGSTTVIDMCAACPDVLTSIVYNAGDNTFTYTDELGGTSVIPLYPIDINVQNASLSGLVLTITETDGQTHNVDLSSLASNYTANADGSYTLTSINGSVTIPAPVPETVTTMVTNADGSITFTSEDGTQTLIPADSVSSVSEIANADGSTTYTHVVNGVDGASWTISPTTTSSFSQNDNTGVITHNNGDGVSSIANTVAGDGANPNNLIQVGSNGGALLQPSIGALCEAPVHVYGRNANGEFRRFNWEDLRPRSIVRRPEGFPDIYPVDLSVAGTLTSGVIDCFNFENTFCRILTGSEDVTMGMSMTLIGNGNFTWTIETSTDGGGTWSPLVVGGRREEGRATTAISGESNSQFSRERPISIPAGDTLEICYRLVVDVIDPYEPNSRIDEGTVSALFHLATN